MEVIHLLGKYEAFAKVVECGSLSAAADALGYTQSGISHMISSLEASLGFRILDRSRSGAALTDSGRRIFPAVRAMLDNQERLMQIVSEIHGLSAGTVRIGTFTSVAVHWLPEMIKEFGRDYPKIEFKLLSGDYSDVEGWLRSGDVDIGFVHMPTSEDYICYPLAQDRLVAILPPDHPLAKKDKFKVEAAAHEPFISLPESSAQDAVEALGAAGIKPDIKFTTKDDYALVSMVAHGLGISIVPELLISGRSDSLAALELDPPSSRTIGLAARPEACSAPATAKFIEYVRKWASRRDP